MKFHKINVHLYQLIKM